MILFGEGSLRKAIHEFIQHYHCADSTGVIRRRQRLGRMLNYYYRVSRGCLRERRKAAIVSNGHAEPAAVRGTGPRVAVSQQHIRKDNKPPNPYAESARSAQCSTGQNSLLIRVLGRYEVPTP
jgi:hypothetical protein